MQNAILRFNEGMLGQVQMGKKKTKKISASDIQTRREYAPAMFEVLKEIAELADTKTATAEFIISEVLNKSQNVVGDVESEFLGINR